MISFSSETEFTLEDEKSISKWIGQTIISEGFEEGEISYVFCDDEFLLKLNIEFLNHDTLTDIISFDYTIGKEINGEIFISVERVKENAETFNESFDTELRRVIIHGILHYCGHSDKSEDSNQEMRLLENKYLKNFENL